MRQLPALVLVLWLAMASALATFAQEGRGKDGRYRNPETGEVQPDTCNNSFKNTHPCDCNRAQMKCDHDASKEHPTKQCQTYCRTTACSCVNGCSS